MFDLSGLNPQQKEAVEATQGAVLVVAGAGTGKTKVLTSRIANIVLSGLARLEEVLAVTFTNKAAREMTQRAVDLLRQNDYVVGNIRDLWIGTFHSLALRMIRPLHDRFGRTEDFVIVDADDQTRIIKKILKQKELDDDRMKPKVILYYISKWKGQFKTPKEVLARVRYGSFEERVARLFVDYQEMLASLNAIDFDDILFYSVQIFNNDPSILKFYQDKFKYILVDEYQDTNAGQYMWLKLLSKGYGNICCVGDDDQSIYSWRGAEIENILNFEKDFENARVIRLEQNYRSTRNILKVANVLISQNKMRLSKQITSEAEAGMPIMFKVLADPAEEATFVANMILYKVKSGYKYSDIAILVRAAFQTRSFEEQFLSMGLPYVLIGGVKFYERKEVKDAIAYLRLLLNPDDTLSFERAIGVPRRGVGAATIQKLYAIAESIGGSLQEAAYSLNNKKLIEFFQSLAMWRLDATKYRPAKLMEKILEESGYYPMLRLNNNLENAATLEILGELVGSLYKFESIREFLDYISLVMDNKDQTKNDSVTISTIHGSKGLEYRVVFVPGFEEKIIPHQRVLMEQGEKGLEEERRLCYVAFTRARKELYLTMCQRRNLRGAPETMVRSRFLPVDKK